MNKFFKILEIIWLITALGCAAITVYFLIIKDTDSALYFVFVFIISAIMYLLRRYQRKNQERFNNNQPRK
jgi:Flp pilus assembly protein TadB